MPQLEHLEAIEKRLWNAADTLRANSNYASNEYFLPVMGLIFLRHAYSRYLAVRDLIVPELPTRGGKTRELTKADFSQKGAIFLQPIAQFDYLVALKDSDDRAQAIIDAMESIEADYDSLRGVLPKAEYQELDNAVLGQLLRTLNPDELKNVSGDIFGRIYEYFLTGFADLKAHDNGEFFTPVSLVSLIANVIEPKQGIVLDPACGSGGMFVQSAHFVERMPAAPGETTNPTERLTFYGFEKNATTIRLAKMNLAVHGLEGNLKKAITYYDQDAIEFAERADFVMANPPFNVDEVDADNIKGDPRLPFGLPGTNKSKKVSNGNYLWISYFFSYLNARGRAGFVMSSQASSAGRDEAQVRRKLVETGAVDVMIAIRSNFFYTRTVPCELWFLDRAKPKSHRDKVLMLDARNIYRKVTRKIYDFSPEQLQNILAIIWLYRGQAERFAALAAEYETRTLAAARACVEGDAAPVAAYANKLGGIENLSGRDEFRRAVESFKRQTLKVSKTFRVSELADASRDLIHQADALYKQASAAVDAPQTLKVSKTFRVLKELDAARQAAVEQLKLVRYFHKQAVWLTTHFPDGKFRDVPGLCKLVDIKELEANDWSLTPGRYVGVAPEEEDDAFDFEATLREIHVELQDLNTQAEELAAAIARNFEELGI